MLLAKSYRPCCVPCAGRITDRGSCGLHCTQPTGAGQPPRSRVTRSSMSPTPCARRRLACAAACPPSSSTAGRQSPPLRPRPPQDHGLRHPRPRRDERLCHRPQPPRPCPRRDHGFRNHIRGRRRTTASAILGRSTTAVSATASLSATGPRPPPLRPPRPRPRRDHVLCHLRPLQDHRVLVVHGGITSSAILVCGGTTASTS